MNSINTLAPTADGPPTQFSVRDILLLLVAAAIVLGLFRWSSAIAILFGVFVLLILTGRQRSDLLRCCTGLVAMAAMNLFPMTYWDRPEISTDPVGWPLTFVEWRSACTLVPLPYFHFDLVYLLVDLIITATIAYVLTRSLRNGWPALIHYLRHWGLETADEVES